MLPVFNTITLNMCLCVSVCLNLWVRLLLCLIVLMPVNVSEYFSVFLSPLARFLFFSPNVSWKRLKFGLKLLSFVAIKVVSTDRFQHVMTAKRSKLSTLTISSHLLRFLGIVYDRSHPFHSWQHSTLSEERARIE